MAELKVEIPGLLEKESGRIEREVEEFISEEEKRKLLSMFMEDVMKGGKQLGKDELVKLGREIKRGRFKELKRAGMV